MAGDDERPPQPQPRVSLPSAPRPRAPNLSTGTGVFSPKNDGRNGGGQQQQQQQIRQPSFAAAAPPPPPPRPPPPLPPQQQQQQQPRSLARPPPPSSIPIASLPTLLATHPGSIIVSKRQEGNPLLKFMTNVRWVWGSELGALVKSRRAARTISSPRFPSSPPFKRKTVPRQPWL